MIGSLGFNMGLVQRSRGGNALRHSAYVCGGSARLADGSVVDFSARNEAVATFVMKPEGSPAWAADCTQLWKTRSRRRSGQMLKKPASWN